MMDEDDTEVILEGGELYKYFTSQGETINDVYSSKPLAYSSIDPTLVTEEASNPNSIIVVPDKILNIVNMILNSDLLLEEDASYLFKRFSELVPQTQRRMSYKFVLPGMIIGFSAYCYCKFNLRKLYSSLMACSTVYLFSQILLYNPLKQIEKIKQILSNLKEITSYIRKNIKLVQVEDSLIYSKGKVQQLRNDVNIITEHSLSRKKLEIFIICQKLICILKSLILLSRNITVDLLKKQNQKSLDSHTSYIALYSDDQLGINKYGDEANEETNVLPFIDILRNVYMLIQSETLRELGMYLCGFTQVEETLSLTDLLSQYMSKTEKISLELKKMYDQYFYPTYVPKKIKSIDKNVRYLGNIVSSISSSLNSLLIDSRILENMIDDNTDEISLDTSQNIGFKLLKMEREMAYLTEHIHTSVQKFLKQPNYFNHNMSSLSSKTDEKIIKTQCMVGTSDFSISGQDEVFFGLVEGTENTKTDNDYFTEYGKPNDLGLLLDELKSALITKREEFERREIKALKSLEDIEKYNLCTTESNKISVISRTESNLPSNQHASTLKSEFSEELRSVIPLDKDLALKACDFLKSWNKPVTDESFGDEIDDDGDDDYEDY
ncbi:uncharacterized protein [Halyomorpha halys]|uniref:uncharacterized protein n=1 Tax=Halyomorpha halys TaxID=286706 RepID=UPI0006D4F5B6|nr:uncharacterized protein LOC106677960 [Halyomorpha halys]